MRTTLAQVKLSRLPRTIGACVDDTPTIAQYTNEAQQRLIIAGGESGWYGGWAKVLFFVQRCTNPFITLRPQWARAINVDVCRHPTPIQNEFYEMLQDGIGLRDAPPQITGNWGGMLQGYERGNYPTFADLPGTSYLRLYPTDPADYGRQVFISGAKDENGNGIYGTTSQGTVNGFYLTLQDPFDDSPSLVSSFEGVQKDLTNGDVLLKAVDPNTGTETLLSRYTPDETTPSYRRYYFDNLPYNCCFQANNTVASPGNVQVTAMVKYEFIPALRDTDFLVIGNIPALIEEVQAIRYSSIDEPQAAQLETKHHNKAIKLLNDEMRHYLGELQPAVNFAPFGNARLPRAGIGTMT